MRVNAAAKCFVADFFAVDANALVDSFQMRRSVQPGAQSGMAQDRFEQRRSGTFSVGAGDVHDWIRALRMPEPLVAER